MPNFPDLADLQFSQPIVNEDGTASDYFLRYLRDRGGFFSEAEQEFANILARQIIAGAGLTGGGDLAADRTLNVGAGTGITVNADDVAINTVDEAERIRDVIGTALVAGANVTITVDDGADTITIAASGGGGGGAWTLVGGGSGHAATGLWVQATDGTAANVNFTGLAGLTELMVLFRNVTLSVSGQPSIQLSIDNGASYYTSSGDYVVVPASGIESNVAFVALTNAAATAARSAIAFVQNINVTGTPKVIDRTNRDDGGSALFVASTSAVNALRCMGSSGGNLTGGSIYLFGR